MPELIEVILPILNLEPHTNEWTALSTCVGIENVAEAVRFRVASIWR